MKNLILALCLLLSVGMIAQDVYSNRPPREIFTLYYGVEKQTDAQGDYYTLAGLRVNASAVQYFFTSNIGGTDYDVIMYATTQRRHVLLSSEATGYLGSGVTGIAMRALNNMGQGGWTAAQLKAAANKLVQVSYKDGETINENAGTMAQYLTAGEPGTLLLVRPSVIISGVEVND